jgi:hypothetical protein
MNGKTFAAIVLVTLVAFAGFKALHKAAPGDLASSVVKNEVDLRTSVQKLKVPALVGCLAAFHNMAQKMHDSVIAAAAGPVVPTPQEVLALFEQLRLIQSAPHICQAVAEDVVDNLELNHSLCTDKSDECLFLSGCIKVTLGLDGAPTDAKGYDALAATCSEALEQSKVAAAKAAAKKAD